MHQEHPEHVHEGTSTYVLHFGQKVKVVERQDVVMYRHGEREENEECFRKLLQVIWRESDPRQFLTLFPSRDFSCAIDLGDLNSLPPEASAVIIGVTKLLVEDVIKIECSEVVRANCGCIIVSGESRGEP